MASEDQARVNDAIKWARGRVALEFARRDPRRVVSLFEYVYSMPPPAELTALYLSGLSRIGGLDVIVPGDRGGHFDGGEDDLRLNGVCPVLSDGCGNTQGLYVRTPDDPRTYFFEAVDFFERPSWCSASSLARLIMISAAEEVLSKAEVLEIDPDLDAAGRVPPIWDAGATSDP